MKHLFLFSILAALISFTSCKKDIYGCTDSNASNYSAYANVNDGSCFFEVDEEVDLSTEYSFTLSFSTSQNYDYYTGINSYEPGDIIITYVLVNDISGTKYWTVMPTVYGGINYFYDVTDSGLLTVELQDPHDASINPLSSSVTLEFKAVHLTSTFIKQHPNLNLDSLEEVEAALQE